MTAAAMPSASGSAPARRSGAAGFGCLEGASSRTQLVTSHFFMLLAACAHAGWTILGKLMLDTGTNPVVFLLYRETLAAFVLVSLATIVAPPSTKPQPPPPVQRIGERPLDLRHATWIQRSDIPRFILLSFLMTGNAMGFIVGLKLTTSAAAALFQPAVPVWATLFCILFKLEAVTVTKVLGIGAAVLGAILMVAYSSEMEEDTEKPEHAVWGAIILLCSYASSAALFVFQRPTARRYHPLWHVFWFYVGACFIAGCVSLYWVDAGADTWNLGGTLLAWLTLLFVSLFTSVFAYTAQSWAQQYLPSSVIALYNTVIGVLVLAGSAVVFDATLALGQWIGAMLVLLGLFLTVWAQRAVERAERRAIRAHLAAAAARDQADADADADAAAGGAAAAAGTGIAADSEPLLRDHRVPVGGDH